MELLMLAVAVVALLLGAAIGAFAASMWLRSRDAVTAATAREHVERLRAELAEAREQTSSERANAATVQAERSEADAQVASLEAQLSGLRQQLIDARDRASQLAEDREAMTNQFKVLSEATLEHAGRKADASAEVRLRATEQLMTPVTATLNQLQQRLTSVETERAALAAELRGQVQQVQLTGEALRRETHALTTALRKPQVRGHWGEVQLTRVAEMAGMMERCDFDVQHTTTTSDGSTIRPDMRVHLGSDKYVWVDAKVPITSFLDAFETDDQTVRDQSLLAFGRTVRTHIDQLDSKKYWTANDSTTPEFVVLFLPSEALLVEAVGRVPGLHEYANQHNVVLATPTTLIALLRAVAFGWKQAALAESAAEVFTLGRELYQRLSKMGGHVDKLGRSLQGAVNAYNSTLGSLETRVMVTARKMATLQVAQADFSVGEKLDQPVRQLTADELVEHATQTTPMIGRRTKARAELPEAEELMRQSPDLFDDDTASIQAPVRPLSKKAAG